MFTGIIKSIGEIIAIDHEKANKTFTIKSSLTSELSIDQSVSHNGICLTVVEIKNDAYKVTAIHETLTLTTSKNWNIGDYVNLETAAKLHAELDGHIVQGHVDSTGSIVSIENEEGSYRYTFEFDEQHAPYLIPKGSVCIDGVSLTVICPTKNTFSVVIIPYTKENTIFKNYKIGDRVNLEFDVIGKYILRFQTLKNKIADNKKCDSK